MITPPLKNISYTLVFGLFIVFWGCQSNGNSKQDKSTPSEEELLGEANLLVKYSDNLFAIPSPYEAAQLLKESGVPFKPGNLHASKKATSYETNFKQALNLGIYGADLGYLTLYDQTPELIKYFSAVKNLAAELDLLNQLEANDIKRIENNLDNRDTLIHFFSNTYQAFDKSLKQDNRAETGALIITGGWIESLHFLAEAALTSGNRQLINRLGEQKQPLNNLIELLSSYYYKNEAFTELIDALVDLAYEFDGIIFNYQYDSTSVHTKQHKTIVYSHSNVIISEYHLRIINEKVNKIRMSIIKN